MNERLRPQRIKELLGKEIGKSDWLTIDQSRINAFAECTEDRQWIHVDPEKAGKGPLKSTVAHGFLILSLLSYFHQQNPLFRMKFRMAANYGLNRVRFIHPVRPGNRIRNRAVLKEMTKKGFRRVILRIENTVEIEGENKPALVAELLVMIFL
ncbi:MAG: MaoC family dehydratase [Candidatus Aminicenantales bacterium]